MIFLGANNNFSKHISVINESYANNNMNKYMITCLIYTNITGFGFDPEELIHNISSAISSKGSKFEHQHQGSLIAEP